jgi:hypothetical protein
VSSEGPLKRLPPGMLTWLVWPRPGHYNWAVALKTRAMTAYYAKRNGERHFGVHQSELRCALLP